MLVSVCPFFSLFEFYAFIVVLGICFVFNTIISFQRFLKKQKIIFLFFIWFLGGISASAEQMLSIENKTCFRLPQKKSNPVHDKPALTAHQSQPKCSHNGKNKLMKEYGCQNNRSLLLFSIPHLPQLKKNTDYKQSSAFFKKNKGFEKKIKKLFSAINHSSRIQLSLSKTLMASKSPDSPFTGTLSQEQNESNIQKPPQPSTTKSQNVTNHVIVTEEKPPSYHASECVGALGFIEPRSSICALSLPAESIVYNLWVTRGCTVKKGEKIACTKDYAVQYTRWQAACDRLKMFEQAEKTAFLQLEHHKSEYERYARLKAANAASDAKYQEIRQKWRMAEAELAEKQHSVRTERALANAAEQQMNQHILRAPMSGKILEIYTHPGERVNAKGVCAWANLDTLDVVAEVNEHDIHRVHSEQNAEITIPGCEQKIYGKVYFVGYHVKKNSVVDTDPRNLQDLRVVDVRIEIDLLTVTQKNLLNHSLRRQVVVRFLPHKPSPLRQKTSKIS